MFEKGWKWENLVLTHCFYLETVSRKIKVMMTCEIQHSQAEAFQPRSALNSSQMMNSVSLRTFDPLDLWLHVCLSKKTRIAFLKAPLWGREDHTESSAPAPPEKRRYKVAAAEQNLCLRLCTTSTELINITYFQSIRGVFADLDNQYWDVCCVSGLLLLKVSKFNFNFDGGFIICSIFLMKSAWWSLKNNCFYIR